MANLIRQVTANFLSNFSLNNNSIFFSIFRAEAFDSKMSKLEKDQIQIFP